MSEDLDQWVRLFNERRATVQTLRHIRRVMNEQITALNSSLYDEVLPFIITAANGHMTQGQLASLLDLKTGTIAAKVREYGIEWQRFGVGSVR